MKKLIGLKSVLIGIASLSIISMSSIIYATDSVLDTGNTTGNNVPATEITAADMTAATTIPTDGNSVPTTSTPVSTPETTQSAGTTTDSVYKTVDDDNEKDTMPQTGLNDGYTGILLIVFVGISIYTLKKIKDYKNL